MILHQDSVFTRKTRRVLVRVSAGVVFVALGALLGWTLWSGSPARLTFSPASTAFAAAPDGTSVDASLTARVIRDYPLLEDLWGVGTGYHAGIHYIDAPGDIKAGEPLVVSVHGKLPDGRPFANATVEISWELGDARYRDMTFTDAQGNVDLTRRIDEASRGKVCIVAVRMSTEDMQSLGYAMLVPR